MLRELYRQMLRYNFKPNHKLDQNYIVDKIVIEEAVKALDLNEKDIVLEIGGGTGFLTKKLSETNKTIVIEKDKKMCEILEIEITDNLEIINKNVLDVNFSELNYTKIIGFIPYSISKEITEKVIKSNKKTVLVVQKEFAEKLVAYPGFKNYTTITVIAQNHADMKILRRIGKKSFFPTPNCESAIILFESKEKEYDEIFIKFIKEIFRYSNKDLLKGLNLISKEINKVKESDKNKKAELEKRNKEEYDKKIKEIDEKFLKSKIKSLDAVDLNNIYKQIFK